MRLRRLSIRNYRGIQHLDWTVDASFACLVGAGDSTKTTILDAMGLVLSSRYNVTFNDSDFYDCDTSRRIELTATVVDLPERLLEERAHGKNRSGIRRSNGAWEHDPLDDPDVEECLIVRLTVDESLEPVWEVVRPEDTTTYRITATERSELGFFRLGEYSDSHLRWGRGSALTSLTASRTDAKQAVLEAQRQARNAISCLSDTPLHAAAVLAMNDAIRLGSAPFRDLRPGLDPSMSASGASLILHDGEVPVSSFGLGSRRLTSLGIQEQAVGAQAILAIDELEQGLEPHRLLHLVRYLRRRAKDGAVQVFLTTHSPLVVESLTTDELFVTTSQTGSTQVRAVPLELGPAEKDTTQGLMRRRPSALLSRRVLVGEGATEAGFLRRALEVWDAERANEGDLTAVTAGTSVVNGEGDSSAPARAAALAQLGYPVLLVLDGDVTTNASSVAAAASVGVEVLQWPPASALEDVIVAALDQSGLQQLVDLAASELSEEGVRVAVATHMGGQSLDDCSVNNWMTEQGEAEVRAAIAKAAKGQRATTGEKVERKAWFKREDRGELLADLVFSLRGNLRKGALVEGMQRIKLFGNGQTQ
jgi:putative ATP-dependent endonuclease of OLD family